MSQIGYLSSVHNDGQTEELEGEVKTLQIQLKIKLITNEKGMGEKAPHYIIFAVGYAGDDIPIGGAWKKRKQRIGESDLNFLSLTIDDPSLPSALNVAAFENGTGTWAITWRRRPAGKTPANPMPNQEKTPLNQENQIPDF